MQFKDFIETVREEVAKRTGKDTMVYPVIKNNDTVYQGLVIKDLVLNLAPTIYLEPYFYRYEDGESMEVLIDDILNTYEEHLPTKDFNISLFMDFGKAKHRITMKVVNTERNKKLLQKVPNIPFYDLSLVFLVDVSQAIQEYASILIHNEHLKLWNITEEELYELAKVNTPRQLSPRLENLHDVFEFMSGESLPFLKELNIKILSNHLKIHGATCIAYPELLTEIYNIFEDNVIIIPSSVHEVLIMPQKNIPEGYSLHYLNDMVRCVNRTELTDDIILSDHVYRFNGTELEIID